MFYTGITNNLSRRLNQHNNRVGSLFTKSRLPVKLVYFERLNNIQEAAIREKTIKDMNRSKKLQLIEKFTSSKREKRV